jgi:hypothetical protein
MEDMEYSKCSNCNCVHNDKSLCTAKRFNEDVVCKQGKADGMKKIKRLISENEKLKS